MINEPNRCRVEGAVLLPLLHRHELEQLLQAVLALQLELVPPQVHGQIAETMALCKFNLTAI